MVSMILTDFDGTLFPKNGGKLESGFIEKIKKLTDCGTIFAVNSGRPYGVLKAMLKEIENRTVFICNDGSQIMYKNCLLYKCTVETNTARKIFEFAAEKGFSVFASLRENSLPVTEDVMSNKGLFNEDIYKIVLIKNGVSDMNMRLMAKKAEESGLRVCFEDDTYMELCNKNADKGKATKYIKKKFSINENVVSFGDGENDIVMFDESNRVYVMEYSNGLFYPGAMVIENMQKYITDNF